MSRDTWKMKKLGDVCEIRPSNAEIINKLSDNDTVSFLPMEDLQIMNYYITPQKTKKLKDVRGSYTSFTTNDVLLAKVTPCFENKKQGIARSLQHNLGFGSSEYIVFRPKTMILSEFIYYLLATSDFRDNGKTKMLGACGLKRLSKEYVSNYILPVPPLDEQKRIVTIIDKKFAQLESLKANAQANLQNAKDLFQSELTKTFSNSTWEKKKLGDVCEIIGGTTPSTAVKEYWNGHEKWITPAEINVNNKYVIDSIKHITKEAVKSCSLRLLPIGTVIFTSRAPIGKVAIASTEFYCNQGFKNFICGKLIYNEYLYFYLLGNTAYLNSIGKGTTFKEVSKAIISEVTIPLPPLPEQRAIVARLDSLNKKVRALEDIYTRTLAACDELKQSFLAKAFAGEL